MADMYIDFNRGSDSNAGTILAPKKNLSACANFNPGAGGGIYLASDSVFDIAITRAANGQVAQTQFNGTESNRARISSYVPSGALGTTKPTVRRRMFPVSSDWQWDSTLNFGVPKGWYIEFAWTVDYWDVWIQVGGQYAVSMNQSTPSNAGYGYIHGEYKDSASASTGDFVNGMGYDTLRWNFDYSGTVSANPRLYLAGYGCNNPLIDPSTYYGPGNIVLSRGFVFSFYGCGKYATIENIRSEHGSGLLLFQGVTDSLLPGFEMTGCETYETSTPIRINCGTNTTAARWEVDVHDNEFFKCSGPAFKAYGKGLVGQYENNLMRDGNLTCSIAGAVYTQLTPSQAQGYEEPFRVRGNDAGRWLNGTGNCTFDGGCYYADYEDNGTVWEYNIARDSYMAWQVGCGERSTWHANISINCEYGANWNNAASPATNDYQMTHCLHIAAKRGSFPHGQGTGIHIAAHVMYQVGNSADLVRMAVVNNLTVAHPENPTEVGMWLGDDTDWTSGKIVCAKNAFIGFNSARLVMSSLESEVNKTSVANSIEIASAGWISASDYRLRFDSALVGAGSTVLGLYRGAGTFDRHAFQAAPAIGPYERFSKSDWFGRIE